MGNFQELDAEVAERVRRAIGEAGVSRHSIAKAALIAPSTFDRLVGGGSEWGIGQLVRVADALDRPLVDLLPLEVTR